jgi:hypothetical protein
MKYEVGVNEYGTYWRLNGELHRENGPAIEYAGGTKYWYLNGKYHREDGPAIERSDGSKRWYLNDEYLTEEEFNKRTKVTEMTVEEVEKLLGHKVKIVSK